jgi:hypothetical protein
MVPKELTEDKKTREFLANKQTIVLDHPPYSPDLAPNDFSFPEDKFNIERKVL